MKEPRQNFSLGTLRFSLLVKNMVSGVAVLLTPGLVFLISVVALAGLYFSSSSQTPLRIAWIPLIFSLAVALILGGFIAWKLIALVSRTITLPALSASNSAQAIAAGDFTQGCRAITNDELADLVEVMNQTRGSLQDLMQRTQAVFEQVAQEENALNQSVETLDELSSSLETRIQASLPISAELEKQSRISVSTVKDISEARSRIDTHTQEVLQIGQSQLTEVQAIAQVIENLDAQSREIVQAVVTIADIADQTNLLALNATIESAKAGEVGAGFAVVAGQIKELAVQTGEAAQAVTSASQDIQQRCSFAVEVTADVSSKLEMINQSQGECRAAVTEQIQVVSEMSAVCNQSLAVSEEVEQGLFSVQRSSAESKQRLQTIRGQLHRANAQVTEMLARLGGLRLGKQALQQSLSLSVKGGAHEQQ